MTALIGLLVTKIGDTLCCGDLQGTCRLGDMRDKDAVPLKVEGRDIDVGTEEVGDRHVDQWGLNVAVQLEAMKGPV